MKKCGIITMSMVGVTLAAMALADDVNPLIGKWVEKLPNGNAVQSEFTATTESSIPYDASGKAMTDPITTEVTYRQISPVEGLGNGFAIDYHTKDGKTESVNAYLKDNDKLMMDFPGLGAHHLTRVQP